MILHHVFALQLYKSFFFFYLLLLSQQRSIQTYFPEIHSWEGSLFDSSNNVILNFVLKIYDQSKYELSLFLSLYIAGFHTSCLAYAYRFLQQS